MKNVTRWSSFFETPRRQVALREFVRLLEDNDLEAFLLNASLEKKIDTLPAIFNELEDTKKSLQREVATIRSTRVNFDSILNIYPDLRNRLYPYAGIAHNPLFEAGMLELKERVQELMDDEEMMAVL